MEMGFTPAEHHGVIGDGGKSAVAFVAGLLNVHLVGFRRPVDLYIKRE